jgi:hypothetical protein
MQTSWWEVVFSGIGVAVIGWVGSLIYRYFREKEDTSSQTIVNSNIAGPVAGRDMHIKEVHLTPLSSTPSVAEEQYHERPTPKDMQTEIHKVSMYAKGSIAETFKGLKIRWTGILTGIRLIDRSRTEVAMEVDGTVVVTYVEIDDYPILKTVRGGEPLTVNATIDYVQTNGPVHLKDARIKFHPSEGQLRYAISATVLVRPEGTNFAVSLPIHDVQTKIKGTIIEVKESPNSETMCLVEFGGDARTRHWYKESELEQVPDKERTEQ